MRTLTCRGKCIETGEWVYGYYCKYVSKGEHVYHLLVNTDHNSTTVDPETIGQYTGILAANGVPIYEGDLIKDKYDAICEILWHRQGFKVFYEGGSYESGYNLTQAHDLKIVGNMHEDSEIRTAFLERAKRNRSSFKDEFINIERELKRFKK